jgi:hypothetical protein
MRPFDPSLATPGSVLQDIDAATLHSSKEVLEQRRINEQHTLIATNTPRWDIIEVNREGVILAGHHGARAAVEAGKSVDVLVRGLPSPSKGLILTRVQLAVCAEALVVLTNGG